MVTDEDNVVAIPDSTKIGYGVDSCSRDPTEWDAGRRPSIMFPTLHEFEGPVSPTINPLVTISRPLITSKIVFTIFSFPSDVLLIFLWKAMIEGSFFLNLGTVRLSFTTAK